MATLVVMLSDERERADFEAGMLYAHRRQLSLLRAHFGEDVLVMHDGSVFATAHLSLIAETGELLRYELTGGAELDAPYRLFASDTQPMFEIGDDTLDRVLGSAATRPMELHEDNRVLLEAAPKTTAERAVIAAYDQQCAITRYRARAEQLAEARLDVVYLIPIELGGAPIVSNALPVDAAIAYALRHGHIVIADDYRIEVVRPLPVPPPHPLRRRLVAPLHEKDRPSPEAIAFHRNLRR